MGEACLDDTAVRTGTKRRAVGSLSHQQTYSAEDDALPCARLPSDDGEVGLEVDGQFVDEYEVPNAETLKHDAR